MKLLKGNTFIIESSVLNELINEHFESKKEYEFEDSFEMTNCQCFICENVHAEDYTKLNEFNLWINGERGYIRASSILTGLVIQGLLPNNANYIIKCEW